MSALVVDASAIAEWLKLGPKSSAIAQHYVSNDFYAPDLLMIEVMSVLRGWLLSRQISQFRAEEALTDLQALDIDLMDASPLLTRAWQHRNNVSAYDAMYVALAELLDCTLLTCDEWLAKAVGRRALVPNG